MPKDLDTKFLAQILNDNKEKSFVQRMFMENTPTLDLGDGKVATHKMAWGESDGKYIVYPTVLYDGKTFKQYDPMEAMKMVMSTGNYIPFESPEQADYFSRNYKQVLKNKVFQ